MIESIPERADIRQLRTQAKDLLRSLQSGETLVDGKRLATPRLADAQLIIARKYGFDSWPKLVDKIETPILIDRLKKVIEEGDATGLDKLLASKAGLRRKINDPIFYFDQPAISVASSHSQAEKLVPILVRHGADPNVRSKWWAGGFSALDRAKGKTVDVLLDLGAKFDVWSAAGQGRIDVLRDLLDQDPASINAPGGDGCRPLHFAATPEIAELLIERGADIEVRDVDHESTPVQYHVNHPEILDVLLRHGAKPDVFTAVVLDDVSLLRRVLQTDPDAIDARAGTAPFNTNPSDGGHIYIYFLGPGKTPLQIAIERGKKAVLAELLKLVSPTRQLIAAGWMEDAAAMASILREFPNLGKEMGPEARAIADAAQAGKVETVRLFLEAGLDPTTTGMDSGSAMHVACWFGYADVVKLLVGRVSIDLRDASHGSPPFGWALQGSENCRNPKGDYPAVVEALLSAGADFNAVAPSGESILKRPGLREDVKEVLKRYGAK